MPSFITKREKRLWLVGYRGEEGENFAQNLKSLNISAEGQNPKQQTGAEILKKAQGKLGAYIEKENQRSTKKDMSYSR